jgi:hypothetical protein
VHTHAPQHLRYTTAQMFRVHFYMPSYSECAVLAAVEDRHPARILELNMHIVSRCCNDAAW